MTAWYVKGNVALITSIISAATWQFSNHLAGEYYSNLFVPIWNTSTRLVFFLVVTALLLKLKKSLSQETILARTDFLTGAASPRAFYELAQMEIDRSRRYKRSFTLVYFDVDNFKLVNDTFGHQTGSDLLIKAVEVIKRILRSTDVIARIGGDEFAVMLSETNSQQARVVINKFQDGLRKEMEANGWAVTFSIGVLSYLVPPKTIDEAVKLADEVMYEVKKNGKDSVKFKEITNTLEARHNYSKQTALELTAA